MRLLHCQVRNFYVGPDFKGDPPLHLKIAAGLTTGALGICVASPTDLVKVRRAAPRRAALLSPPASVQVAVPLPAGIEHRRAGAVCAWPA